MKPILEVSGLNVDFKTPQGNVHALRNINMTVPKGRILGVVGESGSGKSTLVWTILRLLAANGEVKSGKILFNRDDVLQYDTSQLRDYRGEKVSMVFQDPITSQIPVLSYQTQMTDILYRRQELSRQEKLRASVRLMSRVGIPDADERIAQFPHQFSGGMRQRTAIAMALLMDPMLLIADEPTTALDVTMEAQIIHLLREAQSEFDATIMLVSHNLGLIAELCDEVVVMYAGEIVEHASVNDIFFDASHPYTKALLECNPALDLERTRFFPTIMGDVPDLHLPPKGCVFAPRCPQAIDACNSHSPENISLAKTDSSVAHSVRCHALDPDWKQDFATSTSQSAHGQNRTHPAQGAEQNALNAQTLLEIRDLKVKFPIMSRVKAMLEKEENRFVDAVMNASLSIRRGQTLGLVGESGSGKTTLGLSVLGLNQVDSGSIKFQNEELVGMSQRQYKSKRRNIAMMFQDPVGSLSPRRTIEQLLTEPFKIHGLKTNSLAAEARRLCDMVSLPANFLSRYPHELSGGQARRVGVARALALNPALIIADEPSAGLDVSVQGEILNLMIEMQREHQLGYLIISHNLPVIRHVSDKLAIMYLGRIVEQGDCDRVFANPAHPYSEALVNGTPNPNPTKRRQLVSIEGEVPSLKNRPSGCDFHPRCPYVQATCREINPQETVLSDGRVVRCHYPLAA